MGASFLRDASHEGKYRGRANRGESRFIGSDPSGLGEDYSPDARKMKTGPCAVVHAFLQYARLRSPHARFDCFMT